MKSDNEIKERNKRLGIVSVEDVEDLYSKLLTWDKVDFIKNHIYDVDINLEDTLREQFSESIYEFIHNHDEDEILNEIGEDECFDYLRDYWGVTDFIDALLDRGRSWHTGYHTEDFVNALNFKDIKKESQIKILKQLDRTVIENYLKETEKSE